MFHNIDCILEGNAEGIVLEPSRLEVVYVDDVSMAVDSSGCLITDVDTVAFEVSRI